MKTDSLLNKVWSSVVARLLDLGPEAILSRFVYRWRDALPRPVKCGKSSLGHGDGTGSAELVAALSEPTHTVLRAVNNATSH